MANNVINSLNHVVYPACKAPPISFMVATQASITYSSQRQTVSDLGQAQMDTVSDSNIQQGTGDELEQVGSLEETMPFVYFTVPGSRQIFAQGGS